jgi:hypothetical protein
MYANGIRGYMTGELDNLYDPESTALASETKPLDFLIFQAIKTALLEVHTAFPAKITKIISTNFVSVQPLLKRKYTDGTLVELPVIQNVPVLSPNNGTYWIRLPMKVGDTGLVLISERSLDVWKVSGGSVDPNDPRTHDLTDGVFIPGLYPMSKPIIPTPTLTYQTDLEVVNGQARFVLQEGGTFLIKNATLELMALLDQIITTLSTTTVSSVPIDSASVFAALLTQFKTFVGK